MRAEFYLEGNQPKVTFDNEWNSLSMFLETDSNFSDVKNHIELKKQRMWMGNTSVVQLVAGSKFEVYTELAPELGKVFIYQKQLLRLMDEWVDFVNDKKERTIDV
jgi:hypothetical protein